MDGFPKIELTTKILSDSSRLAILSILMDGRFHTVHELAKMVKIKDQTASYHLSKMQEIQWVESYRQAKYVYYRLSNDEIGDLMELLMNISPKVEMKSYNKHREYEALKEGRTCYQHLAGKLGVNFFDYLLEKKYLNMDEQQIFLTESGERYFSNVGLDVELLKNQSGTFIKPCIDWTERKFHLSGNLGKAFLQSILQERFIEKSEVNRSVSLTESGKKFFELYE